MLTFLAWLCIQSGDLRGAELIAFPHLKGFQLIDSGNGVRTYTTRVDARQEWDEAVPSWNAELTQNASVKVAISVPSPPAPPTRFLFGTWSLDGERASVKDQKNDIGDVLTDTLVLKKPTKTCWVEVTVLGQGDIKLFTLSLRNSKVIPAPLRSSRRAWGKLIEVPRRSQMGYDNPGLCSPTCISMLLAHWAKQKSRPEWDRDVPQVAAGVNDPNWPGTGNWPFNTAFAGSLSGMRAYVARLTDVAELEEWIAAGIPVATSVSRTLLQGKPKEPDDGHLVVLVGFSATGEPIFNDPGWSVDVRQTYRRADFDKAWATSGRTVYFIYPESVAPPRNRFRHWID
jgi:hypothetical protein